MSILGTYNISGVAGGQGISRGVFNVAGYVPSGSWVSGATLGYNSVIIGVGLFLWSGSYGDGCWMPAKVGQIA
jgi:hypothetical protein